jgi:hypothetical protein
MCDVAGRLGWVGDDQLNWISTALSVMNCIVATWHSKAGVMSGCFYRSNFLR